MNAVGTVAPGTLPGADGYCASAGALPDLTGEAALHPSRARAGFYEKFAACAASAALRRSASYDGRQPGVSVQTVA